MIATGCAISSGIVVAGRRRRLRRLQPAQPPGLAQQLGRDRAEGGLGGGDRPARLAPRSSATTTSSSGNGGGEARAPFARLSRLRRQHQKLRGHQCVMSSLWRKASTDGGQHCRLAPLEFLGREAGEYDRSEDRRRDQPQEAAAADDDVESRLGDCRGARRCRRRRLCADGAEGRIAQAARRCRSGVASACSRSAIPSSTPHPRSKSSRASASATTRSTCRR